MSFKYRLDGVFDEKEPQGAARSGFLDLPHCGLRTPVFMPVATQGALKGMTVSELEELDCEIILGNTYHLGLRPGEDVLSHHRGIHGLEGWNGNILTDSGGFQMVSLATLSQVTETGVEFQSTHGSDKLMLKPEDSIRIQNAIGGDIMMQLDDCVHVLTTGERAVEAMHRSIRWLDRCLSANSRPKEQCVFGIIQGCLDPALREHCLTEMIKRDCVGYAIGGLSGGEKKEEFWKIVALCTKRLPKDKPRYCMGVGYPEDVLVCIALGVDMFDCVYPCRTARFGTALTSRGALQLSKKAFAQDASALDPECPCKICKKYSRAFLHTVAAKEGLGSSLITYHNVAYLLHMTRSAKKAIEEGRFQAFVQDFFIKYHPEREYPKWCVDALGSVGISLLSKEGKELRTDEDAAAAAAFPADSSTSNNNSNNNNVSITTIETASAASATNMSSG